VSLSVYLVYSHFFLENLFALTWNHHQQQAYNLGHQVQAIGGSSLSQNMSSLVVPIPALSGGAKRILIEASSVFVAATTISLGDVGTD
jgi:hypothetical protein